MSEPSAWEKYKQNLGETRPWDIIKTSTQYTTEEVGNSRYNICLTCPELIKLTKQCKKCGCIMHQKAKLPHANCPLGKWGPITSTEDVV